MLGGNCIEFN
jgi:hypothetical protein